MEKAERKAYEKPRIERVELRVEEAVLGVCKTATGGAANPPDCVIGVCLEEIGS